MTLKPYPKYKPSGVEWLGEVPEHWQLKPFWTLYRRVKRIGYADVQVLSVYRDYGVIPKDSRDDNFNKTSDDISTYQLVEESDLAMNKMKAWQGSLGISKYRGIVSPAYFVFKSYHKDNSLYLHHLFRSPQYIAAYLSLSKGIRVNQWDLDPDHHSRMLVCLPPLSEQTTIANFLDRETARIDNLISKQQRMIELLKEKRQAVISHAVTKGLDPTVKMKESGVEWLGEVPEHWEVKRNRYVFKFSKGLTITKENLQDEGIPCINYGEIHSKYGFKFSPKTHLLKNVSASYLKSDLNSLMNKGDFVFADTSEDYEGSGNFSFLCDDAPSFAGYHTVIARPFVDFNPTFQAFVFDSSAHRIQVRSAVKGIKVFSISQAILKDTFSWYPPLSEQTLIADYLDKQTTKFDTLIEKANQAIELLKERRTALISAAVTGKVDVREAA